MTQIPAIAVLDIGKTNLKICLLALDDGRPLSEHKRQNQVLDLAPYPQLDIEGIWQWFKLTIKSLTPQYLIQKLVCTTHGATAVCMSADAIAMPVLDYESNLCCSEDERYQTLRPPYAHSLSPNLGVGLNLGRQLHWQAQQYPAEFAKVKHILMYPQYWGWRMSGVMASEVTSLGCHTDLWNPQTNSFSSLVDKMQWQPRFPKLLKTGTNLGLVLHTLATELGLPATCQVINGIHDSNASLVPYLKAKKAPCTVISTGTWVVIAAIGASLQDLKEQCDMLANVNAFGDAVPCIRFMGGREWQHLATAQAATVADLNAVMALEVHALPSFSEQAGPLNHDHSKQGKFVGPINQLSDAQRTALASLYCAFMTQYCLDLVQDQQQGNIYVEGSFASNDLLLSILALLNDTQAVLASADSTGTTLGTALSIDACDWPQTLPTQKPTAIHLTTEIKAYYRHWLSLIA